MKNWRSFRFPRQHFAIPRPHKLIVALFCLTIYTYFHYYNWWPQTRCNLKVGNDLQHDCSDGKSSPAWQGSICLKPASKGETSIENELILLLRSRVFVTRLEPYLFHSSHNAARCLDAQFTRGTTIMYIRQMSWCIMSSRWLDGQKSEMKHFFS